MKIIFYCQYVFGMGHLFRTIELARALPNHDVTLVAGGKKIDIALPGHVSLVQLPALYMDEKFTTLIPGSPDQQVAEIQHLRKEMLFSLFEKKQPDIFIIELFPFGRTIFGFELLPLLKAIRNGTFGNIKTVCSLRDVLVEKRDPLAYEQRVLDCLNEYFDLLLVHSDSNFIPLNTTFSRFDEIDIPVDYTGFVATKPNPGSKENVRRAFGIKPCEKLIVASAGGGRSGYRLLHSTVAAARLLAASVPIKLEMFTGPFLDNAAYKKISAMSGTGIHIRRFTRKFLNYLSAADLSISMAGYNTCMNILVTQVPALVWPYPQDREQGLRAQHLADRGVLQVLAENDLDPQRFCTLMQRRFSQPPPSPVPINLDGALHTARRLENRP